MATGTVELVDILDARGASMEEMVRLLEEERQAIISFDTERLQVAAARKVHVAALMEELDGTCRVALARAGERHGLADNATLSPIIARTPQPDRAELAAIQVKLGSLASDIRRMLDDNRRLLESSLTTIGRSLSFFQSRFKVAETYGGSGQMVERGANAGLLRREI
ncbi:MAG: flagellar protein FlgN [Desulfuromonadales bacterium]|nr:MAG: flagellar protein FlgN [Desulfuromonadales bacterium]